MSVIFPKKVLIINTFGIGDVLFTTPLMRNLKIFNSDISMGYVCNKRTASVLERLPEVEDVFVYERDEFQVVYRTSKIDFLRKLNALVQKIQGQRYDAVIDLSMNPWMGFLAWRAGIKERVGFNYKKRGVFLNTKVLLEGYERKHVVEYYLDLLKVWNIPIHHKKMFFPLKTEEEQWGQNFLRQKGVKNGVPIIGIVPGGGASWGKDAGFKRWSAEKYAKLADKLIEMFSAEIILMGSLGEQDLCGKVSALMQNSAYSACGQTSIGQFAALTTQCDLNIVNDGGPLHVAVASGAKTVSIFGPVDPQVYGPYPDKGHSVITHNIACRPCYHRFRRATCTHGSCLQEITVEDVLEQINLKSRNFKVVRGK